MTQEKRNQFVVPMGSYDVAETLQIMRAIVIYRKTSYIWITIQRVVRPAEYVNVTSTQHDGKTTSPSLRSQAGLYSVKTNFDTCVKFHHKFLKRFSERFEHKQINDAIRKPVKSKKLTRY